MSDTVAAFAEGLIAFAATNIDDIIILLLFFSQVNAKFRHRHVVFGQYLGFTVIVVASLPGFFGGLVVPQKWTGLLGILPIAIGIGQLLNRKDATQVATVSNDFDFSSCHPIMAFLSNILSPQTCKVATVTIANGGDNISIYIPLFASSNLVGLGVNLGIFFVMVGVWCAIAFLLTRQPTIAYVLSRYVRAVVPFVLIALGLFIMYESDTSNLLFSAKA